MANPKTDGRMIRKSISYSNDFASLSPEAATLFCMIIPHLDSHGKLQGGPAFIKEIVCPKIKYLTIENLPDYLAEISQNTGLKWFEYDERRWIHAIHFTDHQKLDTKKVGKDELPSYSKPSPVVDNSSPELVQSKSRVSPDLVDDKVEDKLKDKLKEEAKGKSGVTPQPQLVDNSKPLAFFDDKNTDIKKQEFLTNLKALLEKTKERYPSPHEQQQILVFVQSNIRGGNSDAIIHCINSLIKAPDKVKAISKYLDAAMRVENGNYNARDSEARCNEFKKFDLTPIKNLLAGLAPMEATG